MWRGIGPRPGDSVLTVPTEPIEGRCGRAPPGAAPFDPGTCPSGTELAIGANVTPRSLLSGGAADDARDMDDSDEFEPEA